MEVYNLKQLLVDLLPEEVKTVHDSHKYLKNYLIYLFVYLAFSL